MPLGSSSAAPVISPGPSTWSSLRLAGALVLSSATSPMEIHALRRRPQARCRYHRVVYLRLVVPSLMSYRNRSWLAFDRLCAASWCRSHSMENEVSDDQNRDGNTEKP